MWFCFSNVCNRWSWESDLPLCVYLEFEEIVPSVTLIYAWFAPLYSWCFCAISVCFVSVDEVLESKPVALTCLFPYCPVSLLPHFPAVLCGMGMLSSWCWWFSISGSSFSSPGVLWAASPWAAHGAMRGSQGLGGSWHPVECISLLSFVSDWLNLKQRRPFQ